MVVLLILLARTHCLLLLEVVVGQLRGKRMKQDWVPIPEHTTLVLELWITGVTMRI